MESLLPVSPIVIVLVAGSALSLAFWIALPRLLAWRGVSLYWRTKFGPALVFDSSDDDGTPVRLLNVRGTFQSIRYTDDELACELVCVYHRHFARIVSNMGLGAGARILVMGGGGFAFPAWAVTHVPGAQVVVAEIDPAIIRIAREHFGLDGLEARAGERLDIRCADAWEVLCSDSEGFDVIVNDAFGGRSPLEPTSTPEGAATIHAHLREGGCYLANIMSALEGRRSGQLHHVRSVLEEEFAHVVLFAERPEEPEREAVNALLARD